jgi:hypothetical protein
MVALLMSTITCAYRLAQQWSGQLPALLPSFQAVQLLRAGGEPAAAAAAMQDSSQAAHPAYTS